MQMCGKWPVSVCSWSFRKGIDEIGSIMTALGLAVAIPAVLGYNALVRGNKSVIGKLNRFAHDLHAYFVTGARVKAPGAANVLSLKKAG